MNQPFGSYSEYTNENEKKGGTTAKELMLNQVIKH